MLPPHFFSSYPKTIVSEKKMKKRDENKKNNNTQIQKGHVAKKKLHCSSLNKARNYNNNIHAGCIRGGCGNVCHREENVIHAQEF